MEKEPWNWQREGQLPPCKPDQGKRDESLGPVLGETPKSLVMMQIRTMLMRLMLTTKTAT